MTDQKGKPFRKGPLLLQYWYKNGKKRTKRLMIIGVAGIAIQAVLFRGQYGVR